MRIIPVTPTEMDTTEYALNPDPASLFTPEMAYAGAEVIRRLKRWQQANRRAVAQEAREYEWRDGRK